MEAAGRLRPSPLESKYRVEPISMLSRAIFLGTLALVVLAFAANEEGFGLFFWTFAVVMSTSAFLIELIESRRREEPHKYGVYVWGALAAASFITLCLIRARFDHIFGSLLLGAVIALRWFPLDWPKRPDKDTEK